MNDDKIYKYEPLWGEWKVDELIGKGSVGNVYRVYKDIYGKRFYSAVKVISIPTEEQYESYTNSIGKTSESNVKEFFEEVLKIMVNEVSLLYELKGHSNVITYEDHMIKEEEKSWHLFIRMEYAHSLKDYIKENSINKNKIIKLGLDISTALILCHKKKILHRDIKEENIFMSNTDDMFKLGDFSVSKNLNNKTSANTKVGTLNYMPPEIIKGEDYSENVDVYCLGIVLYKLLNKGRMPYLPNSNQKITAIDLENAYIKRVAGETMEKPLEADDELSRIVLKACAHNKNDRYKSTDEFKNDLENYNLKLSSNFNNSLTYSEDKNYDENDTKSLKNNYTKGKTENETIDIFSRSDKDELKYNNIGKNRKTKIIFGGVSLMIFLIAICLFMYNSFDSSNNKILNSKKNNKNQSKIINTNNGSEDMTEPTDEVKEAKNTENKKDQSEKDQPQDDLENSNSSENGGEVENINNKNTKSVIEDNEEPVGGALTVTTSTVNNNFTVRIDNVVDKGESGVSKVRFKLSADGKFTEDVQWVEGENLGNGSWSSFVNCSNLDQQSHQYFIKVYAYDKSNNCGYLGSGKAIVGKDYYSATIVNVTPITTKSTFTIKVSNVSKPDGSNIKAICFPTWSNANGNDDRIWYKDSSMVNNTWEYTINIADHNYENGIYSIHPHVMNQTGNTYIFGAAYVEVK